MMIKFTDLVQGEKLFFRTPTSRKPYQVKIVRIRDVFAVISISGSSMELSDVSDTLLSNLDPESVRDANVIVRFINGDTEVVSMRHLFNSLKEAADIAPIRPIECDCGNDPNCTNWRHWFSMPLEAKRLMLEENPGYDTCRTRQGNILNHPPSIPDGWGYWVAKAKKQSPSV